MATKQQEQFPLRSPTFTAVKSNTLPKGQTANGGSCSSNSPPIKSNCSTKVLESGRYKSSDEPAFRDKYAVQHLRFEVNMNAKYGRPISNPPVEIEDGREAPCRSDASLWKRWSAGFQVALLAPTVIWSLMWVIDVTKIKQWDNAIAKWSISFTSLAIIWIGLPLLTYHLARYLIVDSHVKADHSDSDRRV